MTNKDNCFKLFFEILIILFFWNPTHAIAGYQKNIDRCAIIHRIKVNSFLNNLFDSIDGFIEKQVLNKNERNIKINTKTTNTIDTSSSAITSGYCIACFNPYKWKIRREWIYLPRNKTILDDKGRVLIKTTAIKNKVVFRHISRWGLIQNISPSHFEGQFNGFSKSLCSLKDIPPFDETRLCYFIGIKVGTWMSDHSGDSETNIVRSVNFIRCNGERGEKGCDIRFKNSLTIRSDDDSIVHYNDKNSSTVNKLTREADISQKDAKKRDTFKIKYYTVFSGGTIWQESNERLKGQWMNAAKFNDIDVSEDGKMWYHLVGSLPCSNGFQSLQITP